jgi:hypothetical protein
LHRVRVWGFSEPEGVRSLVAMSTWVVL